MKVTVTLDANDIEQAIKQYVQSQDIAADEAAEVEYISGKGTKGPSAVISLDNGNIQTAKPAAKKTKEPDQIPEPEIIEDKIPAPETENGGNAEEDAFEKETPPPPGEPVMDDEDEDDDLFGGDPINTDDIDKDDLLSAAPDVPDVGDDEMDALFGD